MTTGPTDTFHCSCPACGAAVDVIPETALISAIECDRRVTELLAANTAEIERRRAAEAECARLSALVADIGRKRLALAEKLRAAEALAERMWPIVETVGRWMPAPAQVTHIMQWVPSAMCEAAAALVRERDNG